MKRRIKKEKGKKKKKEKKKNKKKKIQKNHNHNQYILAHRDRQTDKQTDIKYQLQI